MTEPVESPVRTVADVEGHIWHVYVVVEGTKWDPEIEMRRRNWLCMESGSDRRFVSPVPDGWADWDAPSILVLISVGKPDLRGP